MRRPRILLLILALLGLIASTRALYLFAKSGGGRGYGSGAPYKKLVIGKTLQGRSIDAWWFGGDGHYKTLIIAGTHGSELSSIELAQSIIGALQTTDLTAEALVIPVLFPDNAARAARYKRDIGTRKNIGRHTHSYLADPNRQFPAPGHPFFSSAPFDALHRPVEKENQYLLNLIQQYRPHRILSIHAIRYKSRAGVFADPRTSATGMALGFDEDSTLAIRMAQLIRSRGGQVEGNKLHTRPHAIYYADPAAVAKGKYQPRNRRGGTRSRTTDGVSLGTWAATAIENSDLYNRAAIPVITIEFPGYAPGHLRSSADRQQYQVDINAYTAAVVTVFMNHAPGASDED